MTLLTATPTWILYGFFSVFLCLSIFHIIENNRLSKKWKSTLSLLSAKELTRFAWSRSIQLWCVIIICLIVITQIPEQPTLNKEKEPISTTISIHTIMDGGTPLITETDSATQESNSSANAENYYPPIALESTFKPAAAKPSTPTKAQGIEDVFTAGKSNVDALKTRYEDIFVSYMFLKKCGLSNPSDYQLISNALKQEMIALNAPSRLQYDILTAAQGSYREVYAKNNCNKSDTENTYTQFQKLMQKLSAKSIAPN